MKMATLTQNKVSQSAAAGNKTEDSTFQTSIKPNFFRSSSNSALSRMHAELEEERKHSPATPGVESRSCLRIYNWDEVTVDDKLDRSRYELILAFPGTGSRVNDFYAAEVAPFEGASFDPMLPKVWNKTRYAEFFLGVVTENAENAENAENITENADVTENIAENIAEEYDEEAATSEKLDSREKPVSHLMQLVKNRVSVDAEKVIFQTAASLTCNLRNRMILARAMNLFKSREATMNRMRLKLIAFNTFVALLKGVRMRKTMQSENMFHKRAQSAGSMLRSRRSKSSMNFSARRMSTAMRSAVNKLQVVKEKHTDSMNPSIFEGGHIFVNVKIYDKEMAAYKQFLKDDMRNRGKFVHDSHVASLKSWEKSCRVRNVLKKSMEKTLRGTNNKLERSSSGGFSSDLERSATHAFSGSTAKKNSCRVRSETGRLLPFVGGTVYVLLSLVIIMASGAYSIYEILQPLEERKGASLTPSMVHLSDSGGSNSVTTNSDSIGTTLNYFFVIIFTIDLLLRLVHEGCHDFWFDVLSVLDVAVVVVDWIMVASNSEQVYRLVATFRIFKGLRLLRLVRIARTSRTTLISQHDFKRPLSYRDLFALDLLEGEFESMSNELSLTFKGWAALSEKSKYDVSSFLSSSRHFFLTISQHLNPLISQMTFHSFCLSFLI